MCFFCDAKNIKPPEYDKEKQSNMCGSETNSQKINQCPFQFDFFCILPTVLYAPFGGSEKWPSGRRRTPGKCVYRVKRYRGFESPFLR